MAELDRGLLAAHHEWLESDGKKGRQLVLPGADLRGACLATLTLSRADLSGADLSGADLNCAELYNTRLVHANLSGADLFYARLADADLSGANLSGADLSKADFSPSRLAGAVLRGAQCVKTAFNQADLTGADLSRAYLLGTYFSSTTILDGVDFTETDVDLILDREKFDVSRVAGMIGTIGVDTDLVTVIGDGPERQITVAELVEILNRRGAQVTTWPKGKYPEESPPWRWGHSGFPFVIQENS